MIEMTPSRATANNMTLMSPSVHAAGDEWSPTFPLVVTGLDTYTHYYILIITKNRCHILDR